MTDSGMLVRKIQTLIKGSEKNKSMFLIYCESFSAIFLILFLYGGIWESWAAFDSNKQNK